MMHRLLGKNTHVLVDACTFLRDCECTMILQDEMNAVIFAFCFLVLAL